MLEDYLANFKGCVIVVSHDRFFLDRIVDHLFVFKGNGVIKDFPGDYSTYRHCVQEEAKEAKALENVKEPQAVVQNIVQKPRLEKKPSLPTRRRKNWKNSLKKWRALRRKRSCSNLKCRRGAWIIVLSLRQVKGWRR